VNKLLSAIFPPLVLCCLPACGMVVEEETDEGEDLAVSASALLVPNALVPNALVPNALVPNALVPNALASIQRSDSAGESSRLLLEYTVGCAFDETQSFSFSWTDAAGIVHPETYQGLLGIAPGWATAPLTDQTRQRLVSACLAARTNWYGEPVLISARSHEDPLRLHTSSEELSAYPNLEGAFWGNLFGPEPYLNACHNPATVDLARSRQRDCAAGHVEAGVVSPCGMIALVGPCNEVCDGFSSAGQHYIACIDRPGVAGSPTTKAVITTALP
jgi:hypothetical protein